MNFIKKYWKYAVYAVIAYIVYRIVANMLQSKDEDKADVVDTSTGSVTTVPIFSYNPASVDRAKKFGVGTSNSQEVAYLQTWLNLYYKSRLKADGNWGARTSASFLMAKPLTSPLGVSLNSLSI